MCELKSVLIALAALILWAECHVVVYHGFTNQVVEEFYDMPAAFGPAIPPNALRLRAVESYPKNACTLPLPPPKPSDEHPLPIVYYVLVIQRTNCTFEQKIRNAQAAGFNAAIVYNIGSDELEQMSAKNSDDINITSVFVGETTGRLIIENYLYDNGYILVLNDELPFNINTHLILPFSILVGLCFIIMICYMIMKCVREQRRLRDHRLPKKLLKKIPTVKFVKGQPYDTCVICLDDFVEGDKLRILPCGHAYHSHCIDVWLTKNRRNCPICKRKVRVKPRGESRRSRRRNASSDSMSDSETDDTTPLLNPVGNSNNHGSYGTGRQIVASTRSADDMQQLLDDENVSSAVENGRVSANGQSSQRVNPFDREPNLPPNLVQDIGSGPSFWNHPLLRFFRRRRTFEDTFQTANASMNNYQVPDVVPAAATANIPTRPASNNILNTNLSGSFKDSDEEQERSSIYEPAVGSSSSVNIPPEQGSDSLFIQTPTQGAIGVVALPNTSFEGFNTRSDRQPRGGGSGRDFIV